MIVHEVSAKSLIVPSKLPDTDYVINPYTGCQFGCLYCYATFMGRFVQETRNNWGNYVYIKTNSVEIVRRQLSTWKPKKRLSTILLSSVTDPYQGIEKKYRLTRGILEEFRKNGYPGRISILTKSPLVLRDIDIIRDLNLEVGITITTTDDNLARFLEVAAPTSSRRLDTLRKLVDAGISTYAFVGPLLPHYRQSPELLDDLFGKIADTGNTLVYLEHINLTNYIRDRIWREISDQPTDFQLIYQAACSPEHRDEIDSIVNALMKKHMLQPRLGGTIYHQDTVTRT